ncbi:hypothetical protein ABZT28_34300 [Streptomyces sp. NPDC005388]|uniref:hypothetical protein n=1 Tax=Streptomyces sp. NPDC005388 TaxID=3156717 RepID=UPI0033BCE26F
MRPGPEGVFDLGALHRIAGQTVGSTADLVFESVEIYTDATVFSVGQQGGAPHILVRVQTQALSAEAEQERFAEEVQRARRAAAHPRVADLLLYSGCVVVGAAATAVALLPTALTRPATVAAPTGSLPVCHR